jgi:hypothetical protein
MKGLKNRRFVFEMDPARAAALYNAGMENLSVWLVMTKYGEHLTRRRKTFRRSKISGRI